MPRKTKNQLMTENYELKEENRELKEERDVVLESMGDMYEFITNDKGMTSISLDQPLKDIVHFNVAIMLKKFKMMSDVIEEGIDDKTLIERIDQLKCDHKNLIVEHNSMIESESFHRKHFNMMIDLIKGCDTDEKLQKLKTLDKLDEE